MGQEQIMSDAVRFSTIVAAVALLAAVAVLVVMVGVDWGSPGDVAYASDPGSDRVAVEAEAREARRAALARRVESGEMAVVQAAGKLDVMTRAIDLAAVQSHCRTVSYNYDDCVTARIVIDALRGDCTDCRDLGIWIFYNESGRVTHLSKTDNEFSLDFGSLENMGLSGVIPPQIGDLTGLEEFDVSSTSLDDGPLNQLTGSIPQELGDLSSLNWLSLAGNRLSGTIPSQIGNLTSLTSLWLYSNQLTGPIPPEIGNLSSLTHLALSSNQLSGSIPSELGKLTNLEYLSIDNNQLTGCVPASLREAYDEASGDDYPICQASVPTATPAAQAPTATPTMAAGSSSSASRIDCGDAVVDTSNTGLVSDCEILLGMKSALRGSAKLNWWSGRSIERWDGITVQGGRVTGLSLPNRSLDGILPAGIGGLSALTTLDLSGNSLTGQIPAELNNLANLTRWRLAGNSLSGCVPSGFAQVSDNDAASLGLPTCGGTAPTPTPVPPATPTPAPPGTTPTPTPTPTVAPGALDSTLTWHIHCQADDFVAAFGEEYVMDEERTFHYVYERNGRGLWNVLRTIWRSPSNPDRSVACMTKVYDNVSSAAWDNQYTAMLEEALGSSDVLRQNKRCCIEIGNGFKGLMLDIGSTFSDGRWQDTLTSRSGVASFRREQVIVRIASYDRGDDGGYHLLQVDEMAREVNSRFYDGIFDEIETRSLSGASGARMSAGTPVYLNPFSPSGE